MSDFHRVHQEWRTSSYSTVEPKNCVELAALDGHVAARDSMDPAGPVLGLTEAAWRTFMIAAKRGDHDIT